MFKSKKNIKKKNSKFKIHIRKNKLKKLYSKKNIGGSNKAAREAEDRERRRQMEELRVFDEERRRQQILYDEMVRETEEKEAAEKKAAEKKAAEKRAAEKKAAEKKAAEKRAAEKRAAEKKAAEKKAAEKKATEKKVAEKKVAEKRAAEKKAVEKKAADFSRVPTLLQLADKPPPKKAEEEARVKAAEAARVRQEAELAAVRKRAAEEYNAAEKEAAEKEAAEKKAAEKEAAVVLGMCPVCWTDVLENGDNLEKGVTCKHGHAIHTSCVKQILEDQGEVFPCTITNHGLLCQEIGEDYDDVLHGCVARNANINNINNIGNVSYGSLLGQLVNNPVVMQHYMKKHGNYTERKLRKLIELEYIEKEINEAIEKATVETIANLDVVIDKYEPNPNAAIQALLDGAKAKRLELVPPIDIIQAEINENVRIILLGWVENILTRHCPNPECRKAWLDFQGCAALTCGAGRDPGCGTKFCALCEHDYGPRGNSHNCFAGKGPNGALFCRCDDRPINDFPPMRSRATIDRRTFLRLKNKQKVQEIHAALQNFRKNHVLYNALIDALYAHQDFRPLLEEYARYENDIPNDGSELYPHLDFDKIVEEESEESGEEDNEAEARYQQRLARRQAEELARRQGEEPRQRFGMLLGQPVRQREQELLEAARQTAARRHAEEQVAARRHAEEQAARRHAEEQVAARRHAEEQAAARRHAEEQAAVVRPPNHPIAQEAARLMRLAGAEVPPLVVQPVLPPPLLGPIAQRAVVQPIVQPAVAPQNLVDLPQIPNLNCHPFGRPGLNNPPGILGRLTIPAGTNVLEMNENGQLIISPNPQQYNNRDVVVRPEDVIIPQYCFGIDKSQAAQLSLQAFPPYFERRDDVAFDIHQLGGVNYCPVVTVRLRDNNGLIVVDYRSVKLYFPYVRLDQ